MPSQMKTNRRRGAILTLVIVALGLMAVVMLVLTEGANTMLFQADAAYCRAVERNLTASALAWGQSQAARGDAVAAKEPLVLDCDGFGDRRASLTVQFVRVGKDDAGIRIATSCSKGRHTLTESTDYAISRP
jgi:hypothetical protein